MEGSLALPRLERFVWCRDDARETWKVLPPPLPHSLRSGSLSYEMLRKNLSGLTKNKTRQQKTQIGLKPSAFLLPSLKPQFHATVVARLHPVGGAGCGPGRGALARPGSQGSTLLPREFCPTAQVSGKLVCDRASARSQRRRHT